MVCHCAIRRWVRGNLIGAGSFGKVNLAINMGNGELFAVKSIDCSTSGGAEMAAIENELMFLQSLDSPFIIRCFGGDRTLENGVQMRNLFMEYMAGGSLADLMRKFGGSLDEALIRVYTRGILEGLDYLHRQGVVHCDVKGKNILIGASGVKIADLGSAKRLEQKVEAMRGTPLWMAPEVIMQVEQAFPSDIWSLGCTVVEMATGRPPWNQVFSLFAALMQSKGEEELPPLPDCLSAEGKDFLSKCFQRDPKQRWTAAELLKHPFVQKKGDCMGGDGVGFCGHGDEVPLSPTSVLDVGSDATGSWDTNEAPCTTVSLLCGHGDEVPLSPTSVLDVGGDATGSWDTNEAPCTTVPLLHFPQVDKTERLGCSRSAALVVAESNKAAWMQPPVMQAGEEGRRWITVRSPRLRGEERQMPLSQFMLDRESAMMERRPVTSAAVHLNLRFFRARSNCVPPIPTSPSPATSLPVQP